MNDETTSSVAAEDVDTSTAVDGQELPTDDPKVTEDGTLAEPTRVSGNPDFVPQHVLDGGRDFAVPGNDVSGYIGVSPEYMTYANPANQPRLTDLERFELTDQYDHLIDNADDLGYLRSDKNVVDADEAQTVADELKAIADKAQHDAEEAQARADELKKSAGKIPTTADEAQRMADDAQALADKMRADEEAAKAAQAEPVKAEPETEDTGDGSATPTQVESAPSDSSATTQDEQLGLL